MKTKTSTSIDVLSYLHQNNRHLEKLFTHLPDFLNGQKLHFEEIDAPFLASFKIYLSERLMPSTVKDRMSCLRTLVKRAIVEGITTHDPFVDYRIQRANTEKPYFTPSQIKKLLSVSENIHPEVVSTFLFALYTGFHRAKIINMTIAQTQALPLKGKARKLLYSIAKDRKPNTLLFDKLPCIARYYQQTRLWGAFAGLNIRPSLEYARNTFIINELKEGKSIREVADYLGVKELRHLLAYEKIVQTIQTSRIVEMSKSSDSTLSRRKHLNRFDKAILQTFPLSVCEEKINFTDKL